jgi:hypothetical protein
MISARLYFFFMLMLASVGLSSLFGLGLAIDACDYCFLLIPAGAFYFCTFTGVF